MFIKRLISGIILVLLSILIIGRGGILLWFSTLVLSLVGLYELYKALKLEGKFPAYLGYICTLIYYLLILYNCEEYIMLLFISTLLIFLSFYVFTFPEFKTEQISTAFFGILYVGVLFAYIYKVRMWEDGQYIVWLIILSSWGSDTCAYAVGMLFGKHKAFPKLSPKKSIEGCIGGVLGSVLLGILYASFVDRNMIEIENPIFSFALACAIGSVISQIGDLAASAIKRNHDIKDFGNIIPGHGGVLDRFDSVLFTAPAIFFALMFI